MKRRSILKTLSGFVSGLCFWRKSEAEVVPIPERSFEERFEDGKRQYAAFIAHTKSLQHQYHGNPEKVMQAWAELEKGCPKKEVRQVDHKLKAEVETWNMWAEKRNRVVQDKIDTLKTDSRNDGSDDWGRMVKEIVMTTISDFHLANPIPNHPIPRWGFISMLPTTHWLTVPIYKVEDGCPLSRVIYERTCPTPDNGWSEVTLKHQV